MKTLINGKYFEITADAEVIYLHGKIIRISDDNYGNWGIVHRNKFIRLSVFEVDGVTWYFTNHTQELEIRTLAQEILPARGFNLSTIEWFKTVALSDQEYNDQYAVYYKIKGKQSYHSAISHASSEKDMIDILRIKTQESGTEEENFGVKGDNQTLYNGHCCYGLTMYLHIEEDNEDNRNEVIGKWQDYVPDTALEIYVYRGWLFYRDSYSGGYKIDCFSGYEFYDSLADMERLIREYQVYFPPSQ